MAYLDVLCSHLSRLPEHELLYLDNEGFRNLPKLAEKSVPEAVSAFRAHLQSISDLRGRLDCAAHLYGCLAGLGVIRHWALYRADQRERPGDVVGDMLKKMRHRRVHGLSTMATANTCCTCLLAPDEERGRDFKPYLFVDWYSRPCIAIHEEPEGHSTLLATALRQTFGSRPESFRCGVYQDLNSAHVGSLQLFP
ncbi:hypothetical protein MTO96_026536 [Rhipicephalus appendiculatus]